MTTDYLTSTPRSVVETIGPTCTINVFELLVRNLLKTTNSVTVLSVTEFAENYESRDSAKCHGIC